MSSGVTDCVVVMRVWNQVLHFSNPHFKKKIQIKNGSLLVDSTWVALQMLKMLLDLFCCCIHYSLVLLCAEMQVQILDFVA